MKANPVEITASVVRCDFLNLTTRRIVFDAPEIAKISKPGQFISILIDGFTLRRPISISDLGDTTVSVIVEDRGEGTHKLMNVKAGDNFSILGPLGKGFPELTGRVAVVGGGLGVPPMLLAAKASGKADAFLGFRDINRIILQDEFEAVCESVYITTDDGSFGEKGPAVLPLKREIDKYDAVFACGPKVMLKAVAELCEAAGKECFVSLEERMGCGVGACLVCACKTQSGGEDKMSRVCKDGPVFNAKEVVW